MSYSDFKVFLDNNSFINDLYNEKISSSVDDIDDDMYDISKEESLDMLDKIDSILEDVETDILNIEQSNELKRYLHTFKGAVRMSGANKLGSIAHRLESIMDYTESREISLYKIKDLLNYEIEKIKFIMKNPKQDFSNEDLIWLDSMINLNEKDIEDNNQLKQNVVNNPIQTQTNIVKKEEKQYIKVQSNIIDELINDSSEIRLSRTTLENIYNLNFKSLNDLKNSSVILNKMIKEIEIQAESQIQATKVDNEQHNFDPLEFDRFTRLQELTRFMNEAISDIQDTILNMSENYKNEKTILSQQEIFSNASLDILMNVRLVPIDTISDRLYKITRNTSKEVNKKVTLKLTGEKIEIDRIVLDRIISPLEHILRNCIAHGIEAPELRVLEGKNMVGLIKLDTIVDGNLIIINISDDGGGINLEKVKEIGLKKGLIKSDIEYTNKELVELIFMPGFSTANSVSQVSGRGVGMDVVKNEIIGLGGSILIETEKNKGSSFKIILPVSVATNQSILTDCMGKLIAIPALLVNEIISVKKVILQNGYKNGYIKHRGKNYPLYYLGHMYGLLKPEEVPEIKAYNTMIIISYQDQDIIIQVDKLKTTTEILIKKIGPILNKISGLLGATILGDGTQGVVINPVLLMSHYEKYIKKSVINKNQIGKNDKKTVMVVDDSITLRKATAKILERNNFNVIFGKDGADALDVLQTEMPDIILSDIEMPRMDGFEFVKNLKTTERFIKIPIIMITSRTADKHKEYALSLGVDDYLGKPYQEDVLIKLIKSLLNK